MYPMGNKPFPSTKAVASKRSKHLSAGSCRTLHQTGPKSWNLPGSDVWSPLPSSVEGVDIFSFKHLELPSSFLGGRSKLIYVSIPAWSLTTEFTVWNVRPTFRKGLFFQYLVRFSGSYAGVFFGVVYIFCWPLVPKWSVFSMFFFWGALFLGHRRGRGDP